MLLKKMVCWASSRMVVVLPLGLLPQPSVASLAWWLSRPLWLVAYGVVMAGLVVVFGRFERRLPSARYVGRPLGTGGAVIGTAALSVTFALTASRGTDLGPWPLGLPVPTLLCAGLAAIALRGSASAQVGEGPGE